MPFFLSSKSNSRSVAAAQAQNGSIRAKMSPVVKKVIDSELQRNTSQTAVESEAPVTSVDVSEHVCDNCLQELDRDLTLSPRMRSLDVKSIREFEVERQRMKRTTEREQRTRGRGVNGRCNCCGNGNRARQHGSPMRTKKGRGMGAVAVAAALEKERWSGLAGIGIAVGLGSDDDFDDTSVSKGRDSRSGLQVTLGDLIRVEKVRKSKASDFEVIPPVRSVVVLDDFDFSSNIPALGCYEAGDDEAWEHVYASDSEEVAKAPSYAQIASSGMKH